MAIMRQLVFYQLTPKMNYVYGGKLSIFDLSFKKLVFFTIFFIYVVIEVFAQCEFKV